MTAEAGYVYIDHGVDTPYVKIGKTPDLRQRLAGIQQGVPFPMQLLWAERVADIDHAEDILKQRYALYHIRGEWYALPPAMRSHWGITIPDTTAYEETYQGRTGDDPPSPCARMDVAQLEGNAAQNLGKEAVALQQATQRDAFRREVAQ